MPREVGVWKTITARVKSRLNADTAASQAASDNRRARHEATDNRLTDHEARQRLHRITLPTAVTDQLAVMTRYALPPTQRDIFFDNLGRFPTPRMVAPGTNPDDPNRPLTLGLTAPETAQVNDVHFPPLGKDSATVEIPTTWINADEIAVVADGIAAVIAQVPLPGTDSLRSQFVFTDAQVLAARDTVARLLDDLDKQGNYPIGASVTFFSDGRSTQELVAARNESTNPGLGDLRRGQTHEVWTQQPMITFTLPRPMA